MQQIEEGKWKRQCTSLPPGLYRLLMSAAREQTVDPAVVLRQALMKHVGYSADLHEDPALLAADEEYRNQS